MKLMENGIVDSTYMTIAQFYKFINIFGINTHEGWSVLLSLIGILSVISIIVKTKKVYNNSDNIFICSDILFEYICFLDK